MRTEELRDAYRTRLRPGEIAYVADAFGDTQPMVAKKVEYLDLQRQKKFDPWVRIILDGGSDTLLQSFPVDPLNLFTPQEAAEALTRHQDKLSFFPGYTPLDALIGQPELNREFVAVLSAEALNRLVAIEFADSSV
jgi:hypothetical protein